MYNPSQNLPISKPLGASGFPLDGKYMFYTNGTGGVYAYRPFISVSEVLSYFTLGSEFRKGFFEILINTGGTLSADGGSISGGSNSIWWWRNGVSNADLVIKNESISGKTKISGESSTVSINWQVDIAPGGTMTFAVKHGNDIIVSGIYDAGSGVMTPYTPNFTYTLNNSGNINILTFTEVFGAITIL